MDLLHAVFNHVVLPPKLPGTADSDENAIAHELNVRLMRACETLGSSSQPALASVLHNLRASLRSCMKINQGRLEKKVLLEHFQNLLPHHTLILYVVEQNAALIVRRQIQDGEDWVIFEAFEASPSSEQVLAAQDALIWAFPGRSVRVPFEKLDGVFLDSLTTFLEQASMEPIVNLQAQTQKANVSVAEIRDTADPALITQMLMPLLEAVGEHVDAIQTTKRIRDDVNFLKDLPWRRLPFWLVLRVAVQRYMTLAMPSGQYCYKALMCVFLAQFLKESCSFLAPDLIILLRAKLCRRMAKLEMKIHESSPSSAADLNGLLAQITPLVRLSIAESTAQAEASWLTFKRKNVRRVPKLPPRASPGALVLSLAHSGQHLDGLLSDQSVASPPRAAVAFPEILDKANQQGKAFTDHISRIATLETQIEHGSREIPKTMRSARYDCDYLAQKIDHYFQEVASMYDSDPLQVSTMLLNLFDLYIRMDACAIVACPLLIDHRPVFPPELLDTLLLPPNINSMTRLQDIQNYLETRTSSASHDHILSDVNNSNAFAVRFVKSSSKMRELESLIEDECQARRLRKAEEWQRVTEEYDTLTEAIETNTCLCEWRNGQRSVSGCRKCWHWRCRKKIQIQINEELLPNDPLARSAVLFELAIPDYMSAYRHATWRILRALHHPKQTSHSNAPNTSLRDCRPLEPFTSSSPDRISLASAKKCFQGTHYKFTQGKISLERVLLPFAAQFQLFDPTTETWVKDIKVPPSLHHICGVHLPPGLEGLIRPKAKVLASNAEGLSSYEIQANQTECPSHMAISEFSAYQKLLSGTLRRWRNLLVELGASNINFSSSDATQMLVHLSLQAGPRLRDDSLRSIHAIFREEEFVESLAGQIEKRLCSIMDNWRESNCMELLINLCLKIFSLSSQSMKRRSRSLLKFCRNATLGWIAKLHDASARPREGEEPSREKDGTTFDQTKEGEAADRMALYAFKAALLCRLTFEIMVESPSELSSEDLISWVKASVALQENLVDHIGKLPPALKSMMIRDAKMAFHLEDLLRKSLLASPHCIGEGIQGRSESAANPSGAIKQFSEWKFLDRPYSRWAHALMFDQVGGQWHSTPVHFDFVEGHLLFSGKPRGKLPVELRSNPDVISLFGTQHLFTYTSALPHMTHRLATPRNGHEVHFGKRDDYIVIRALVGKQVFEYIPRRRFFGASSDFDLPASLVDNCFHWLNLSTGDLEIRREDSFWGRRQRNWILDVRKRSARRGDAERFSALVDPRSEDFRAIAVIFRSFVEPHMLTVYQPTSEKGKLSVEMKHLDLSFFVNNRGSLFSGQLNAEVDPNQDLGTWYGLESKIVLRDSVDWSKRSVIIPLGSPSSQCLEPHVSLHIKGSGFYGRFEVDSVLGRLTCAPEPRLIYTKALCHALTSFCLPDPLTKRTGTEEAFAILRSAAAQPWSPIDAASETILQDLARLVLPQREYYPPRLRRLQRVVWNGSVTSSIQHDGYESIIREIETKGTMLTRFSKFTDIGSEDVKERNHLRHRGEIRRRSYERPSQDTSTHAALDMLYPSRDRIITERARRVFEIASMTQASSGFRFESSKRLTQILESSNLIGGFHDAFASPNSLSLINQIEDPVTTRLGDLISFCRSAKSPASPAFCLSLLAFGPCPMMDLIVLLAGFSCIQELKDLALPSSSSFADFKSRGRPSIETIRNQVASAYIEDEYDSDDLGAFARITARQRDHKAREREGRRLSDHILKQWPRLKNFYPPEDDHPPAHIDTQLVVNIILPDWERRRGNDELERFIEDAQSILRSLEAWHIIKRLHPSDPVSSKIPSRNERRVIPSRLRDLVTKPGPILNPPSCLLPSTAFVEEGRGPRGLQKNRDLPEIGELGTILERFRASSSTIMRRHYSEGLLLSLKAYRQSSDHLQSGVSSIPFDAENLKAAVWTVQDLAQSHLRTLCSAFAANDRRYEWLQLGGLWPDVGAIGTLELLRSGSVPEYGAGMKQALVSYGRTITELQRLRRIKLAVEKHEERIASEEFRNKGHENWDPLTTPDMLLLEVDSDLLIRPDQIDAVKAIMSPASKENSVFQMNMGKGKTSVILPIAAALLADGRRLVRLIVPKPLLLQTAQTLQARLGGLVGRQIRHVPFSRQTPTTNELLGLYEKLHMDMYSARGVILTSHEHILSYKLGGLQRLADNKLGQASQMVEFQNWIDSNCRDVLDESDFTLAVKTQLNYPSGSEEPVDGHPYRWQVIEELLSMVAHHVPELVRRFRRSIEILGQPGWFPIMQFLNSDVFDEVHKYILDNICAGQASFLRPVRPTSPVERAAIRGILSHRNLDVNVYRGITTLYPHPESAAKQLLIVRGLITHNIIPTCLAKRWNIQYGLRAGSYPVAVPYESRNVPSERAEWGHPDVAIIFTCLSFYYSGVNPSQFRQGLRHVLTCEDPASQYERWISQSTTLPEALHHWNVINLEDEEQVRELWRHLHKTQTVINHFLNIFVFPLHAKQFSVKLQASAWDIPLSSTYGSPGVKTTGFSGTKDSLLPRTIKQDDLPNLMQTNAEVLSYLLQPRNRLYELAADHGGKRLSEAGLLRALYNKYIRVFIDAGAYIIEMSNREVARLWLDIDSDAKAAVYFGEDNRAWVMFRDINKRDAPLLTTPFVNQLDDCVVYLDEAHTRGVDMKFGFTAGAALTLSLKQTKDFTVQAAMRLRQLKTTQRVVFFSPPEVDGSIRSVCGKNAFHKLDSSDVVYWLLEQTCRTNEDVYGLQVAQGLDFCKRQDALLRYPDFLTQERSRHKLLGILREPEYQTLEQLYGVTSGSKSLRPLGQLCAPHLQALSDQLFRDSTTISPALIGAFDEVEQEREVEVQLESVREIEKPVRYRPFTFPGLHGDILRFAQTGRLQAPGAGFEHAFSYIGKTKIGMKFQVKETGSRLYVSTEFGRTVALAKGNEEASNIFLRPVEWILWSPTTETALVIIPEEAELLMAKMRPGALGAADFAVHLIAYAAPLTRSMTPFNTFRYYALPPLSRDAVFPDWLRNEVGILSGRLYVDYPEWSLMTRYLHPGDDGSGGQDGTKTSPAPAQKFTANPVDFLLEWLSLGRKARDVLNTPVGFICMRRFVPDDHPFFLKSEPRLLGDLQEENSPGGSEDEHDGGQAEVRGYGDMDLSDQGSDTPEDEDGYADESEEPGAVWSDEESDD